MNLPFEFFLNKPPEKAIQHAYEDLISLFSYCFEVSHQTKLICGEDEPIYIPASPQKPYHQIVFAHGFFSSALHECAHWFIAGPERRKMLDYGYWYIADGRDAEQQLLFQQVEVKPQAIEWLLSIAAGHPFRLSADNLNGQEVDTKVFEQAVYQQALWYCQHGLPPRAAKFEKALRSFYLDRKMVGRIGIEPMTKRLRASCSTS